MGLNAYLGAAQLGLGALGLSQQNGLASAQQNYLNQEAGVLGNQNKAYTQGLQVAENYNPAQSIQGAVDYAGQVSADSLSKALTGLNQQFGAYGGNALGDSAFRVNAQGAANRVADPLKEWAANEYANQTQMKLGALQQAVGLGGGLAQSFGNMANQSQPNYGPSASMLSSGINTLAQMYGGAAQSSGLTGSAPNNGAMGAGTSGTSNNNSDWRPFA